MYLFFAHEATLRGTAKPQFTFVIFLPFVGDIFIFYETFGFTFNHPNNSLSQNRRAKKSFLPI